MNLVNIKEKINILEMGRDVPFYNDVPKLSKIDWLVVLASVILTIAVINFIDIPPEFLPFALFLLGVGPALYICKGDYSLFFKKVTLKDIGLIIVLLIGIYLYTIVVVALLSTATGSVADHADMNSSLNILTVLFIIIQLFGEEFFKIFMLLLVMYGVYKLTNNSNIAVGLGLIGAMVIFGLCHYYAYDGRILQIILIQGFGSIFEYFAYLKTKNVWVSYLLHLVRDLIPTLLILFNVMPT